MFRSEERLSDLERARELGRAALQSLEANRRRIDDLNVYPVPDGDTGTNLTLTARAVVEALDASQAPDRDLLPDPPRRRRGARRRGADRRRHAPPRLPRRERRGLPGRPPTSRGDDALRDP
jgi:hypothetical protein